MNRVGWEGDTDVSENQTPPILVGVRDPGRYKQKVPPKRWYIRFQVLIAVNIKTTVLWNVNRVGWEGDTDVSENQTPPILVAVRDPGRYKQKVPPKRWYISARLHGIVS